MGKLNDGRSKPKGPQYNKPKPLYGIGINDADYVTKNCPFYQKWHSMFVRCYSSKHLEKQPTYVGNYVHTDFIKFSDFKAWMVKQKWEGLHLDKDLLSTDGKVYGPDTCVFVPRYLNNLFTLRGNDRGEYPLGVTACSNCVGYVASVSNKYYGYYYSKEEAHKAWQQGKIKQIESVLYQYAKEEFFNIKVANSLTSKAWKLQSDIAQGKETFSL